MPLDIFNFNQPINGNLITFKWLIESLRENDKDFQKLHGNRIVKKITAFDVSDGKGFASEILRCTLTFKDSKNSFDVYTTILKIPSFDSMREANKQNGGNEELMENALMEGFSDIHEFECDFYKNLAPILGAPVPKVFKTQEWIPGKQDGCIHMEDLTQKGKCLLIFESINLTQVKNFIRELAHMHKNILIADPKLWHGKYLKNATAGVQIIEMAKPMVEPFLEKCKQKDDLKLLLSKYGKFLVNPDFIIYANTKSHKDLYVTPVIVHGDMQSGNIMWAIDEEGNIQNEIAAIIDWQTIYEGSPMTDLAVFLLFCCDGVVRRQAEEFAIEYYLECLTKEFDGDATKIPYNSVQLKKSYNYMFLSFVYIMIIGPTFMLAPIQKKESNKALVEAYFDSASLRILHAFEDAGSLLEEEMKEVFEKFNA